ncbi:thermonuclease family protein [uncultured Thermanaerothrix sp.]|uniref:thermonuclease family protein n=1 Tax=uncultured Thermanaerothrix sp. TaxID=1195149 RepID=UPI002609F4CB|nr:thermonuclease family protein [uncultured Thermanaerothrix sp.]
MPKRGSSRSVRSQQLSPTTLLIMALVLLVLALIEVIAPEKSSSLGEPTSSPSSIPLFTNPSALACLPAHTTREQAKVIKVIDGDTIEVEINGTPYKVRYIGIDTPESTTRVEYFGKEAAARNQALVDGQQVILIKDVSETDRYNRLLRYVLVGEVFVNYELVRGGYANTLRYPPDVACADIFREAERQAREERLGLWAPTPAP